jgi:hypothetical protein
VCWRPGERRPSCAALLISIPRDRDARFLLGPMLRTLFFMVGHKVIWGRMPIVPMTQTTVTADQRPKTGCNRPDQVRSTGDKKPIS